MRTATYKKRSLFIKVNTLNFGAPIMFFISTNNSLKNRVQQSSWAMLFFCKLQVDSWTWTGHGPEGAPASSGPVHTDSTTSTLIQAVRPLFPCCCIEIIKVKWSAEGRENW